MHKIANFIKGYIFTDLLKCLPFLVESTKNAKNKS